MATAKPILHAKKRTPKNRLDELLSKVLDSAIDLSNNIYF